MRIKIISDSTCDLSPELIEKNQIAIVPLTIVKEEEEFYDCVNITPADIFQHVANGGSLCSTAAANIGQYDEVFAKYAAEFDGVIHIDISSEFSSCYQNACLAAQNYDNVRVIDSRNLSTGHGLVVLKACELAKSSTDLDALAAELNDFTSRVEASFLLDRLDYMVKGGRCSMVAALGANLLNLKPCIEVKDGKMSVVKKYRGNYAKCLASYVKDRLQNREDIERTTLFVTHTPVTDACKEAVAEAVAECPAFENTYWTNAGCTVSCHCGPGTLGVLFVRNK